MEDFMFIDNYLEFENTKSFPTKNPGCYIISVVSNKGGAGKTSIALTTGLYLAKELHKKTLLLEIDSSPGDFGVFFNIETDKSLDLALRFPERFGNYVKNIFKNFDVMKGVSDPLIAEGIKEIDVQKLFKFLTNDYDRIVIDTQTVINGAMLDVLRLSDIILLISDYSIESFSRISHLYYILTDRFIISKNKIKIIINKKQLFKLFKIWEVVKNVNVPLEAFISYDSRYSKSLFIFNKNRIYRTKLYKQLRKILSNLS